MTKRVPVALAANDYDHVRDLATGPVTDYAPDVRSLHK